MVSGAVHTKRYLASAAGEPLITSGQISTWRNWRFRMSYRTTMPPTEPRPEAEDQMISGFFGSGVAHPPSPPPTSCHSPRLMVPPPPPPPPPNPPPPRDALLGPTYEGPSWRLPNRL